MTYEQWAGEYKASAELIKKKIDRLKLEAKIAPASEIRELDFRISTLQSMYIDCMKTAGILMKRKGAVV